MIVVSSNNTAVENISKEFPLKRKISEKYQENMKDIQLALAVSDVFLSKIGSLQTA